MDNLTMQRYTIALGRGFKGSYRQFLKQNPSKDKFPERPRKRSDKRAAALEEHVIACLGSERHVAE